MAFEAGLWLVPGGQKAPSVIIDDAMPLTDPRAVRLAELAARVHRAVPGLRGFVGIDLVWHPQHGPVVIEVNPRVTCAYVGLSRALGRNLAAQVIARHDEEAAQHA